MTWRPCPSYPNTTCQGLPLHTDPSGRGGCVCLPVRCRGSGGKVLDKGDGAVLPVDRLCHGDGLLHALGGLKPDVSDKFGRPGSCDDDPADVLHAPQGIAGHEAVDGMKGIAEAVLVDVFRPVGEILLEEG